jgi:hypothetical protein
MILVLIPVALCPGYTRAQEKSSPSKAEADAQAALREKAYELLETLAGQLGSMQSPENRARIGSNIVGSLWTHNETRARELLGAVQQDINAGLQVPDSQDREDVQTLMVFLRLRMDTITRIVKHDPDLAYEFFKATALSPEVKLSEQAEATEQALEIQLAGQVAATSPELTRQLARKVLARGFSPELRKIFRQLNRKHKEQATALYADIVEKIGEADLVKDWNARYFAGNFANSITPPEIDEASYNELINQFLKIAAAHGCNRKMAEDDERAEACSTLIPLITIAAKVNPARSQQFSRWKTDNEGGYYYWQSAYSTELDDTAAEGTVEDMLALTSKYPQMENEIRWRAFRKARYDNDLESARKVVNASHDAQQQQVMLEELNAIQARAKIDEEKLAQVQKRLGEIKTASEQARFLAAVANQIGEHDRKTAMKLLNQANGLLDTMKPGGEQLMAQMVLAMIYCYYKNDRGFTIMEPLVPKLNELIEASSKLDGIERRYLRNGEWNMSTEGSFAQLLTTLAHYSGYFAHCDFERAVSLAGQFERTEIRMMAQLKLAQGILAGPPRPLPLGDVDYER